MQLREIAANCLSKAEDVMDKTLRSGKHLLPIVARFCLTATFFEDGLRMYLMRHEHREYIYQSWGCGEFLAKMFVLFNLCGQLSGSLMIIARLGIDCAVGLLFCLMVLQVLAYAMFLEMQLVLRQLSTVGALLLVLVEARIKKRSLFAGLPTLDDNKTQNWMQLAGRILLALMFMTLIRFELSFLQIVVNITSLMLMISITIGHKTRLAALALVVLLTTLNFYYNAWWTIHSSNTLRDFRKFDFFQTLSVVGGLLIIVLIGPGGVSVDVHKKKW